MSWLSDLGNSVLGGVIGGATSDYFNSASQERQYQYNKDLYQHRYQWQVEDMRKAGLNPVLAGLNGSVGSTSVGMVGANTANSFASDHNSARQIDTIQKRQLENQTKQTDSTLKLNAATEKNIASEITRREIQNANETATSAANVKYLNSQDLYLQAKKENEKLIAGAQVGYYGALGEAALMDAGTRLFGAKQLAGLQEKQGTFYDLQSENWRYKNIRDKAGLGWYEDKKSYPGSTIWNDLGEAFRNLNPFKLR